MYKLVKKIQDFTKLPEFQHYQNKIQLMELKIVYVILKQTN